MLPEKSQSFSPNKKRKIGERRITGGIKSTLRSSKKDFGEEYSGYIPSERGLEETKSRSNAIFTSYK